MTTVREAIEALGIGDTDTGTVVLAVYDETGGPWHKSLDDIGDCDTTSFDALYVASGLFRPGAIVNNIGRSNANVTQVNWLVLDCDLHDYIGVEDASELWSFDQRELDDMVAGQVATLSEVIHRIGVPMHRVIATGYGVAVHVRVRDGVGDAIATLPSLHKQLIARINDIAEYQLVDPQASDAGARITRVPGSRNTKGAIPRDVRILSEDRLSPGVTAASLEVMLGGQTTQAQRPRPVVTTDRTMPGDMEAEILNAVAPHWQLGHKHNLSLALAGMLAKAGVKEAQTLRIIAALSADDEKPYDRRKGVEDTYRKVRSGIDVRGYHGLLDYLPTSAVAYIDQRLQQVRQATKPAEVVTFGGKPVTSEDGTQRRATPDDIVRNVDPTPIPKECYRGWLATYVEMMLPLCEAPASFHLASALGLAGATFGRRLGVRYVSKTVYPNEYFMLIGVAGDSKKDTAIELALDLPERRGPMGPSFRPFEVLGDVGSAEGLIGQLATTPNLMLYITEYQRLAQNAKRKSTSTIIPTLTTAWNAPNVMQTGTRAETNLQARLPTLSILAAVQPDVLNEEMTANEMASGFASRWLYVPGKPNSVLPDPPSINEHDANRLYVELSHRADDYGRVVDIGRTVLDMTPEARERWHDWYFMDHARKQEMNDLEAAVASRLAVHIRKIALIYAGMEGARAIEVDHLNAAIAFVEWCWTHTLQLMQTWGTTYWTQIEERIKVVLGRGGTMARRRLHQQCSNRKWGAREFAQVLDAMIKVGAITVDVEGNLALAA